MRKNTAQLSKRIEKAFADSGEDAQVARDIAFHMTDWDHDLEQIVKLYEECENLNDDEIIQIIIQFLVHAPNHIAAAKKLSGLGPITDIFEVGALEVD